MIVYQNYTTFTVMDHKVNLISDQTDYGINTVAEIDEQYFYLGDEPVSIIAAIAAWEELNNVELSEEDFAKTLIVNDDKLNLKDFYDD